MFSSRRTRSRFQPTLPLRGATRRALGAVLLCIVSTHAPLAGSDMALDPVGAHNLAVSTHAPLAGSDYLRHRLKRVIGVSTHAPLAGSDVQLSLTRSGRKAVSTHAPLAGSDCPTPRLGTSHLPVSTHAPLAGSDVDLAKPTPQGVGFNPRSPCGERLR